jgi:hypothetical protein
VNDGPNTPPVVVLPGGSGIVPAGLSNNNGLPSLVGLLPSSVSASGAIGGVTGGDVLTAGGGPIAPPLTVSSVRDLLELIALTQLGGGNDNENDNDSAGNLMPLILGLESHVAPIQESLSRLIDGMYSVTDWLNVSPTPPQTAPTAELESSEMEDADPQEARAVATDPFVAPGVLDDQTWVGAVTALALYHGVTRRRRGQPRTRRQVSADGEALACA